MQLTNEEAKNHQFLNEMYEDGYYPNFLVDKGKTILINLCYKIEDVQPANLADLYELTNQSTDEFNELQEEFAENESEIETACKGLYCRRLRENC